MTIESSQATTISASAMRIATPAPPPLRSLLLRPPRQRHPEKQPEDEFAEERDDAGNDDRDHEQPDIAVADVGQFVPEHRLDLGIVERSMQARS